MAELLKGVPAATKITEELSARCEKLKARGIIPTLAMLRVGEKPGDLSYESGAEKRCAKIGITVKKIILPDSASKGEILGHVSEINNDDSIHGLLMFRPLDDKDIESSAREILSPSKDVDCMTDESLAGVFTGANVGYPPCTAQACIELLGYYGIDIAGKNVAVIGRSLVIGRPVSMLLMSRNATVTICHSKTRNLPALCRNADIIIAAIGRAKFVGAEFVSEGQTVIDVGINVDENGKLCGDVDFDAVSKIVRALSPVPGGVGALTTAVLAKHVIESAEKLLK
ncbi:MAG: bifunctional 5,10-methylene-tetrahydrofolate dehydrogenase/5,10-methylene-tetrahydrofolate cyclohydrolase [Synergistaceae bacterium]|nr:bifunctional 5,10-methylene-tetrahydrofolate dehydrogenase/5,10-methylene-tetrahydrofolate cyclohydrolase [Synergistaceae bacterium]